MVLWTVQSRQLVQTALATGIAYADWDCVEPAWRPHYRWLMEAAKRRGFSMSQQNPPLWTWHSCGGWLHAPEADDFNMLLGSQEQPHLDLVRVELEVDPVAALLTDYEEWCEILYSSPNEVPDDVPALWYSSEGAYSDQTLQACIRSLSAHEITGVADLKFSAGSWRAAPGYTDYPRSAVLPAK